MIVSLEAYEEKAFHEHEFKSKGKTTQDKKSNYDPGANKKSIYPRLAA